MHTCKLYFLQISLQLLDVSPLCFEQGVGQIDDLLGRPNGDGVLTGQLAGRSGLGFGLSLGLSGSGGRRSALGRAGDHTEDHDEGEYDS